MGGPDTTEHLLRDSLVSPLDGHVLLPEALALAAAEEIAWLRAERISLSELVLEFSSESAPETLATVAGDRDKWHRIAMGSLDSDLELVAAETAEAEARAAETCSMNRLRRDAQASSVENVRARLAEHREAGEVVSAALRRRQAAVDSVLQRARHRASHHATETSDV